MRNHKAIEKDESSQSSRDMKNHKAIQIDDKSQASRESDEKSQGCRER